MANLQLRYKQMRSTAHTNVLFGSSVMNMNTLLKHYLLAVVVFVCILETYRNYR